MEEEEAAEEFDVSLPQKHQYLQGLQELEGTKFADDSVMTVPMIENAHVYLVPSQTIPLTIRLPSQISMFKNILQKDRLFGVKYQHVDYGTIAEVKSISDTSDTEQIVLKAKGQNVYKILEKWRDPGGILMGRVFILPDNPEYPDPLNYNCLLVPYVNRCNLRSINSRLLSAATGKPNFIYEMYEPERLMKQIKCRLNQWAEWRCKTNESSSKLLSMPSTPLEFSYWLAANIPLDDKDRLTCLTMKSSIHRLRTLLDILKSMNSISCKNCRSLICPTSDIFSLSLSGPQGSFVNPGGYNHELVTVRQVTDAVTTTGQEPSSEYSWFPGYQWTICYCAHCYDHLGWKFTVERNRNLHPKFFWGLTRSATHLTYEKKHALCTAFSY